VKGYYRKDGTYVKPHTRTYTPSSKTYTPSSNSYTNSCDYTTTKQSDTTIMTDAIDDTPPVPKPIIGKGVVYSGETGIVYKIEKVSGAKGYVWNVPHGWTYTMSDDGTSIFATPTKTAQSGYMSVYSYNDYGASDERQFGVTLNNSMQKSGSSGYYIQFGYAYSSGSPFNLMLNTKWGYDGNYRWGFFTHWGGFGNLEISDGIDYSGISKTEIRYDNFDFNNCWGVTFGVLYSPVKAPFYISFGLGYGVKEEYWSRGITYHFTYIKDEYRTETYIKDKKSGINYHFELQYDFFTGKSFVMGMETFYNRFLGVGVGLSLGLSGGAL